MNVAPWAFFWRNVICTPTVSAVHRVRSRRDCISSPVCAHTRVPASFARSLARFEVGKLQAPLFRKRTLPADPPAKSTEDDVVDYNTTHGVSQIMENINDDFLIISRASYFSTVQNSVALGDTFLFELRRDRNWLDETSDFVLLPRPDRARAQRIEREENWVQRLSIFVSSQGLFFHELSVVEEKNMLC